MDKDFNAYLYRSYYAHKVARDLCDENPVPQFEFGDDSDSWTTSADGRRIIHIGLKFFEQFPDGTEVCKNEEEWHTHVRYVTGHEEGHIIHTTNRAWIAALTNSIHYFIDYAVQRVTGQQMRLVKEDDYSKALQYLSDHYHVSFNMRSVQQFTHFIVNSIEDGRMERRMASAYPGFKIDMRYCRAKTWMHSPIDTATDISNPAGKLIAILNQVLSLATTGLYQKGFLNTVTDPSVVTEVNSLKPLIEKGVTARSCRKGLWYAEEINRRLTPLFFDACQLSEFEKALNDFIKSVLASLPDLTENGEDKTQYDADENSTEQQDGKAAPYQLTDDSDENAPKEPSFNIFNDDRETKEAEEEDQSNADAEGKNNMPEAEEYNSSNADGNEDKGTDKNADKSSSSENSNNSKGHDAGGKSGSKGQYVPSGTMADEASVLQAMKEAAEEAGRASKDTKTQESSKPAPPKGKTDSSTVASAIGDVSDICRDFIEEPRVYELTEDLPADIESECRTAHALYEEYFKSRRKPTEYHKRTGKIDPRGVIRLATRQIDIFKQKGEDNSFSGCIEVLVDRSGSMAGDKMRHAMEVGARLEGIFSGLVPLKIAAFDTYGGVVFETIKNWEDEGGKNRCWNFLKYGRDGGGTPTLPAVRIAERELTARPEKHKMLILITDESGDYAGDGLDSAIKEIRSNGVKFVGVYIEHDMSELNKRGFYRLFDNKDALAISPDELTGSLLPIVKDFTRQ
ncbi:MAG: hypothetical protein SPL63_01090 [Roseburia faecis]|nr:hypothetical protein [Roseburia faecis]